MPADRIDYYYMTSFKSDLVVILAATVILLGPPVYLGIRFSWPLAAIPAAIFVPVLLYAGMVNRVKRNRARTPAITLLEDRLEIPRNGPPTAVAYGDLKSIVVESGRGYRYMTVRYIRDEHIDELTLDAIGLAVAYDLILETIAHRVPKGNNPKLGKGVLFCTPVKDVAKLYV